MGRFRVRPGAWSAACKRADRRPPLSRPPLEQPSTSYEKQLEQKVKSITLALRGVLGGANLEVISSPPAAFRYKCGFGVWRDQGTVGFAMPDPRTGKSVEIRSHFAASSGITKMMSRLLDPLNHISLARRGLCTYTMFSTCDVPTAGKPEEGLVALGYNVALGEQWLQDVGLPIADALGAMVVGRGPRGERVAASPTGQVLSGDGSHLVQRFAVDGKVYPQHRRDGIFVQCNVPVGAQMLSWSTQQAAAVSSSTQSKLLFEPYCGNGNFSLPLACFFGCVVASDVTAAAVDAAKVCAKAVGVHNVAFSVKDADAACIGIEDELREGCFTALLNPPREGASRDVMEACTHAEAVIYVSCNPATLHRDIQLLRHTHAVTAAALFDQFPFSSHVELGVTLERRR